LPRQVSSLLSDGRIRSLAARQGGHVTHRQLVGLGLSSDAIRHGIGRGYLIPVHRGVHAVGFVARDARQGAHAALLAAGEDAVLSGALAGWLLGMLAMAPAPPWELMAPGRRRRPGLIIHQSTRLLPVDVLTLRDGLRCTNRARTLLDLARGRPERELERLVNRERIDHGLRLASLHDVLGRFPRHPGAGALRAAALSAPDEPFRSPWEVEWPTFARAHDLPPYDMNVRLLPGLIADVVFRPRLLILELDGWGTHGGRAAFRRDRARDRRAYDQLGIPSFRVTYEDLHEDPAAEAAQIRRLVERRRDELHPAAACDTSPRPPAAAEAEKAVY
jgi:hypothetical protein